MTEFRGELSDLVTGLQEGPCQSTVGYNVNVVERRWLATKKNKRRKNLVDLYCRGPTV